MPSDQAHEGQRRALLSPPNKERGSFAEYINVKAGEETWVIPDEVTDEEAATTPVPFFTAVCVDDSVRADRVGWACSARPDSICRRRRATDKALRTARSMSTPAPEALASMSSSSPSWPACV